ncbi:YIP1 family protein [Pararhodobacter oceanensis]|uniref:YIP1 family protein n=1 Tax=Pararhodobacter oceanensis TaxID=2172121 RepID=A0A2T8HR98_9RHOB|nr:YIP1 family protein [Pararhodobacter oceanensis]PVH27945.1 YIP1 family protein [Pararhodobacter oceanensis]
MSVSTDMLRSFRNPRAVVRGLRQGQRREARILVYLMIACALFFIAQWPRLARQAHLDDSVPFEALMAGALFGSVFMAPLMFYAIGGILTLVCRIFERAINGFDVRLALFWALLVVSPLVLLQGLVTGMIGNGPQATLTGAAVFAVFAMVLAAGLRVALEAARAQA